MTTGSLGLGFPVAAGLALGNKLDGKDSTVYTLVGDGEIQRRYDLGSCQWLQVITN